MCGIWIEQSMPPGGHVASTGLEKRLEELRADFASLSGAPFRHFFCPILFVDEDAALCKGHVISQAFPDSARHWTVQRKDVDSFYGSRFEADFTALLCKERGTPASVLFDKKLSRSFDITITVDGEPVDHYFSKGDIPEHFTGFEIGEDDGESVLLGLKMDPTSALEKADLKCEVWASKDFRVPALVSLIKAGYLTLFTMLGYRYALSVGGVLVGGHVLGQFFKRNAGKPKKAVLDDAREFFGPYAHMVRPALETKLQLAGSVADGNMLLCRSLTGEPWAVVVFVRTSRQLHAVLLPLTENESAYRVFVSFLRSGETTLRANSLKFEQDHWTTNPKPVTLEWPKGEALLE